MVKKSFIKEFQQINEEGIINWDYHHFPNPDEIKDPGSDFQFQVSPTPKPQWGIFKWLDQADTPENHWPIPTSQRGTQDTPGVAHYKVHVITRNLWPNLNLNLIIPLYQTTDLLNIQGQTYILNNSPVMHLQETGDLVLSTNKWQGGKRRNEATHQ